jgi:hypothetical protein
MKPLKKSKRGLKMNITTFDRKKYVESLKRLERRGAPSYVVEAYRDGYVDVVNGYYDIRLHRKLNRKIQESKVDVLGRAESIKNRHVQEALKARDEDFLKAFFIMTNLDIVTGNKLPPNAGKLLRQDIVRSLGLKDLFKKLK